MQRTYRERKHYCGEYMEVEIFPVYTKAKGRGETEKADNRDPAAAEPAHEQYSCQSSRNNQRGADFHMNMEDYFCMLKAYADTHTPSFGEGESVLTMLYECHNENSPYDNEQIKADFNELYQQMNGMTLREIDQIIYPVC